MPKARILFDSYGYVDDAGEARHVGRNEDIGHGPGVIEVSGDELDRGVAIGGLEKLSPSDAKKADKQPASEPGEPPAPRELTKKELVALGKTLDPPLDLKESSPLPELQQAITDAGASILEPTTPAGDPAGDGKHDQDA